MLLSPVLPPHGSPVAEPALDADRVSLSKSEGERSVRGQRSLCSRRRLWPVCRLLFAGPGRCGQQGQVLLGGSFILHSYNTGLSSPGSLASTFSHTCHRCRISDRGAGHVNLCTCVSVSSFLSVNAPLFQWSLGSWKHECGGRALA